MVLLFAPTTGVTNGGLFCRLVRATSFKGVFFLVDMGTNLVTEKLVNCIDLVGVIIGDESTEFLATSEDTKFVSFSLPSFVVAAVSAAISSVIVVKLAIVADDNVDERLVVEQSACLITT